MKEHFDFWLEAPYNFHKATIVTSQTCPIRFFTLCGEIMILIVLGRLVNMGLKNERSAQSDVLSDADRDIAEDLTSTVVVAEGKQIMHIMKSSGMLTA